MKTIMKVQIPASRMQLPGETNTSVTDSSLYFQTSCYFSITTTSAALISRNLMFNVNMSDPITQLVSAMPGFFISEPTLTEDQPATPPPYVPRKTFDMTRLGAELGMTAK